MPTWLVPSAPGQLSNKHGSNSGGDAITLKAHWTSPTSYPPDGPGAIRAIVNRVIVAGGAIGTPETGWDSGWLGTAATSPCVSLVGYPASATYNGRVYLLGGQNAVGNGGTTTRVVSATIGGYGAVGSWRGETSLPRDLGQFAAAVFTNSTGQAWLVIAGGLDNVGSGTYRAEVYSALINGDGSLGSWVQQTSLPAVRANFQLVNCNGVAVVAGGTNSGINSFQNTVYYATVTNGQITAWSTSGNALNTAVANYGAFYDPVRGYLFLVGGWANPATTVVQSAPITNGVPGAWSTTNALPAGRSGHFLMFDGSTYVYVVGGDSSTIGLTATTTVYATSISGNGTVNAWTTSGTTLTSARTLGGSAFISDPHGSHIIVVDGFGTGGLAQPTVYSATVSGTTVNAFANGAGSELTSGNLGTSGVVTNNADGTVDLTFLYGGFGQGRAFYFGDGDQAQLTVQLQSAASGDLSPVSPITVIKIGQPPTISNVTWSDSSGHPMLSWAYGNGAGGGRAYDDRARIQTS